MGGRAPILVALAIATGSLGGCDSADDRPVSAMPWETRRCEGATALPPEVHELLSRLASPVRDHCERHRLAGAAALFVRTVNTIAHDDRGDRFAACHWEVFRAPPEPVRHLGSVSACRFQVDDRCVLALDDGASATPHLCVD